MRRNRVVLFGVVAAVIAAGVYLAVLAPLPFVASIWQSRETIASDHLHVRGRMAEGLLHSRKLIGMSQSEIVTLLGSPPPTDMFSDWDMVYWLCPDRSIGIDSEWLVLNFDDSGRASEARLITD